MKKIFRSTKIAVASLLFCATILSQSLLSFAEPAELHPIPSDIQGESAVLMEEKSGKVLFSKNPDEKIFPASTTKILTALVAMEYLKMDQLYVIGNEINDVPLDSSKAGHKKGESILGENLVRGLIIPSGNESACVVAMNVARIVSQNENITYPEAEVIFAELMNKKAEDLGAKNSHFVNPHGYHNAEHYTTAYDIALITREAMKNPVIAEISAEKEFDGNGAGDQKREDLLTQNYQWKSHNLLLVGNDDLIPNTKDRKYPYYYANATGVKTGFTDEAGSCVSASATKGDEHLIATVFHDGDKERWIDAIGMFEYGFDNFDYITVLSKGQKLPETVAIDNPQLGQPSTMALLSENEYIDYLTQEQKNALQFQITLDDTLLTEKDGQKLLKTPIAAEQVLGKITYTLDGKEVYTGNVVAAQEAAQRTLKSDVQYYFHQVKINAFTLAALPYWLGGVAVVAIVVVVVKWLNRRKRGGSHYHF